MGGYTTYQIMPSDVTPPPNRPQPDDERNISRALDLNPDAIIVNMPSNDAASGFSAVEQKSNFDLLFLRAQLANVPIWFCTTQPRNLDSTGTQVQLEMRDYILNAFGESAIDFWSDFANPDHKIRPEFDSGDGVHMNDEAHAIMNQRVLEKNLLLSLYHPEFPWPDFVSWQLEPLNIEVCGKEEDAFQLIWSNIGWEGDVEGRFDFHFWNGTFDTTFSRTVNTFLPSCTLDTIDFLVNTAYGGRISGSANLFSPDETDVSNNTIASAWNFEHPPIIEVLNDTACAGEVMLLLADSSFTDSLVWYDVDGESPISTDDAIFTAQHDSTATYFVQGWKGPFHFSDHLETTQLVEVHWNGIMFDIVAKEDLVIDSLAPRISTLSPQTIDVLYKTGSHIGYEQDTTAWTLLNTYSAKVVDTFAFEVVKPIDYHLKKGDTLALYLYLTTASSTLIYDRVPEAAVHENDEIMLISGTGVSHTFGDIYYPRDWNGIVYYHYGYNADGLCSTEKIPVQGVVSRPFVDLGRDTTITALDTLHLSIGNDYQQYTWSTGDITSTIAIPGSDHPVNTPFEITVEVIDIFGCIALDTISVTVLPGTGVIDPFANSIELHPNPGTNFIIVESDVFSLRNDNLALMDVHGTSYPVILTNENTLNISTFAPGVYALTIETPNGLMIAKRFVKID